jgi:coenzyme PQQ precursor peptide PqqA
MRFYDHFGVAPKGGMVQTFIGVAHLAADKEEETMAWTKPVIREIECGMEINMYGPSEDEGGVLF